MPRPTSSREKPYASHLTVLEKVGRDGAGRLFQEFGLHCQAGYRLDSAVLKIQKRNWSDRSFEAGIFFSIWVGERDLAKNRFNYNIHALKLGLQKCCHAKPVAFAKAFRSQFDPAGWPNVSIAFGPQTLMQGWMPLRMDRFEKDVSRLIARFVRMHRLIDELLAAGAD